MIIALFSVFALTQALDVYTTWVILSSGGTEDNPIMAWGIKTFGLIAGLAVPKAALVAWVGYVFACSSNPFQNSASVSIGILLALTLIYTVVVVHNIKQIRGTP
jgi:Domain of unknown function (DUF5658)